MSVEIHLKPEDAYDYFERHLAQLKDDMVEIAGNPTTGYAIYLTECDGAPWITVTRDDNTTYEEGVVFTSAQNWWSRNDQLKGAVKKIYTRFLYPVEEEKPVSTSKKDEKPDLDHKMEEVLDRDELEFAIEDRDLDITDAVCELIDMLSGMPTHCGSACDYLEPGDLEEIKDKVCLLLSEYGINVYRPMFVEVNGEEKYSEYPFNEYDMSGEPAVTTATT